MTILSDNEIRGLCTPPISVITQNGVSSFSLLTKEQVDEHNQKVTPDSKFANTSVYKKPSIEWRPITEAELATWKPMISDYQATLVNKITRKLNEVEVEKIRLRLLEFKSINNPSIYIREDGFYQEEKIISYGQSSYGYDIRSGLKFKIFSNLNASIVDPKDLDAKSYQDVVVEKEGDYIIIPPNSFALAHSMECIHMPRDTSAIVLGKSTYARAGLNCLATPLESEWNGHITLEVSNTTPLPMKFYAGEGCCQLLFFQGNRCDVSYLDRAGKYLGQKAEVTLPKV